MNADTLEWTPEDRYFKSGNEIQTATTTINNILIRWTTAFYHNWLKDPKDSFMVGLQLPDNAKQLCETFNGEPSTAYYTEDGYFTPTFKTLEDTLKFINAYELRSK